MLVVPLSEVPSQTLQIVLGGQNVQAAIYTKDGYDFTDPTLETPNTNIYVDLAYNGIVLTTTQISLDQKRLLLNRQYLGFVGDFIFIDTQGFDDPQWTGLGSRWLLLYLEATDL